MNEQIILVDQQDQVIGQAEKIEAHRRGLLHRAFSIFVCHQNSVGESEVLLQKRQLDKYHSGGLWSNTCCGHPRVGEEIIAAGERRLQEEMGIKIKLRDQAVFHYLVELDNGMLENEMDHVLVGDYNDEIIKVNPIEVADYCWMRLSELRANLISCGGKYTLWLAQAFSLAEYN